MPVIVNPEDESQTIDVPEWAANKLRNDATFKLTTMIKGKVKEAVGEIDGFDWKKVTNTDALDILVKKYHESDLEAKSSSQLKARLVELENAKPSKTSEEEKAQIKAELEKMYNEKLSNEIEVRMKQEKQNLSKDFSRRSFMGDIRQQAVLLGLDDSFANERMFNFHFEDKFQPEFIDDKVYIKTKDGNLLSESTPEEIANAFRKASPNLFKVSQPGTAGAYRNNPGVVGGGGGKKFSEMSANDIKNAALSELVKK